MGIEARAKAVVEQLEQVVSSIDAPCLEPQLAARLASVFSRGERLCAAGKALAAGRVESSGYWRESGARSAAAWLADESGTSVGQAQGALESAEAASRVPELDVAMRAGEISGPKAAEVASVAQHSPSAAGRLVDVAANESLAELKEQARRASAAACADEEARHRRIHDSRHFRHWVDSEGAGCISGRMTTADLARLLARMGPFEKRIFDAARKRGDREPAHAYALDALLAMSEAAASVTGTIGRANDQVTVLVDHAALVRGNTVDGETCEVPGVGPVPVSVVKEMMQDAFLSAVVTDGIDIYSVTHLGRKPTAHQRTALRARDRRCVVPGCRVQRNLQIDHVKEWSTTRHTRLSELALLCTYHHHQKTREEYRLEGGPGDWKWIQPAGPFDEGHLTGRGPP